MEHHGPYNIRITDADGEIMLDNKFNCILISMHSIHQTSGDETLTQAIIDSPTNDIVNCIYNIDKQIKAIYDAHSEVEALIEIRKRMPWLYALYQKGMQGDDDAMHAFESILKCIGEKDA